MVNLGFTIRSAKWSRYGRPNVSTKLSESYTFLFKFCSVLLFILTLLFLYKTFYTTHPIFNQIFNLVWLSIDNTLYVFSFFYFCSILCVQHFFHFISNFLYSGTFRNTLSKKNVPNDKVSPVSVPKVSWKSVFYSWIVNGHPYYTSVESIFANKSPIKLNNLYLTQNLFQITFDLNTINNSTYPLLPSLFFQNDLLKNLLISDSSISVKHPSLLLLCNFTTSLHKRTKSRLNQPFSIYNWNLYKFTRKEHFSTLNNYKVKGLFYTPHFNTKLLNYFSQNFSELSFLHTNLISENKTIKWRYWLYKYNTLHRNALKSAQSLTIVKNLLTTGFYDTKLTQTNIWGSNEIPVNSFFLQPIYSLLYNTGFRSTNPSLFNNNQSVFKNKNFLNLSYYEQSYLWLIQRMHFFTTMKNNHIVYSPFYTQHFNYDRENFDNTQTSLKIIKSAFFKSFYLSNNIISFQTLKLFHTQFNGDNVLEINNLPVFTTTFRDLHPKKNSFNFFNYTSLSILLELFQNQSNFNSKPSFFNYKKSPHTHTSLDFNLAPLYSKNKQNGEQLKLSSTEGFNEKILLLDLKTLIFILSM